jgi:hypothetical protein
LPLSRDLQDVLRIKAMFKSPEGAKLMSRVVKIALNFKEDLISAVIVARYNFELEDSMVNYAVAEKQFFFLQ